MALVQEGLNLVSRPDATNPRNRQDIGYVFTNDDENSLAWVDRGKALAGATDDHKYERKTRRSPNSFKVIYTSSPFPRQVVSCRADLPPKLVTEIKKILIGMDRSQEGRSALKDFEQTTKFDELAGSSMAQLLSTQRFVAAEIGLR
jgi:phosphonate transport system substrate-binding protein